MSAPREQLAAIIIESGYPTYSLSPDPFDVFIREIQPMKLADTIIQAGWTPPPTPTTPTFLDN